jgi:hypothetical protein
MIIKILTWAGYISSACVIIKTCTKTRITAIVLSRTITISYWNIRLKRNFFFVYVILTYLSSITTCTWTRCPIRPTRPSSINYCTNKNIIQRYLSSEKHTWTATNHCIRRRRRKIEILMIHKPKFKHTNYTRNSIIACLIVITWSNTRSSIICRWWIGTISIHQYVFRRYLNNRIPCSCFYTTWTI